MHSSQTFVMEKKIVGSSASAPSLLKLPVEKMFLIVFLTSLHVSFCRIKFNFESLLFPSSFGLKENLLVLKKIIVF